MRKPHISARLFVSLRSPNFKDMQTYKNLSLENIEGEDWEHIIGYESRYMVSNFGRIKSLPKEVTLFHGSKYSTTEKILKQRLSGGYLMVALFSGYNKNRKDISVHILVATGFISNPENKKEVNHKKGIKTDNRASQLEWNTHQENVQHGYNNNLYPRHQTGKFGLSHIGSVKVQCLSSGRIMCVKDAAKFTEVSATHMTSMLKNTRRNWTTFIYI